MSHPKSLVFTASLALLALTPACGKSSPDTTNPEPAPVVADDTANQNVADGTSDDAGQPDSGTVAAPGATDPAPATEPATPPTPQLTDEEILAVAAAAHTGEIEHAKLAKTKAKDKRVKEFAAMMTKHHTEAKKKGDALAKKAALTPKENDVSTRLTTDAKTRGDTLAAVAKGAEFDKAYIDAQVEMHQTVLDLIDKQLMTSVKNADLKADLEANRATVQDHLTKAKEIQGGLAQPTS